MVVPVALKLGVSDGKKLLPKPNPELEKAFKQNQHPDDKTIVVSACNIFIICKPVHWHFSHMPVVKVQMTELMS